jgi:hypothetical protein
LALELWYGKKWNMPNSRSPIYALCCTLAITACGEDDPVDAPQEPGPPPPAATLAINWSIDGTRDPALCEAVGANSFEATISAHGFFVTQIDVPCTDFQTRLNLWLDTFVVQSTLVNAQFVSATRRIVRDLVNLSATEATVLSVDFPSMQTMLAQPDAGAGTDPASTDNTADDTADAAVPPLDAGTTPPGG